MAAADAEPHAVGRHRRRSRIVFRPSRKQVTAMVARETQLVELDDADGVAIGSCTVAEAHTAPGQLHRAFSVMLLDDLGRVLVQQRAAVKTRFALRWANACCGHPAPGQTV